MVLSWFQWSYFSAYYLLCSSWRWYCGETPWVRTKCSLLRCIESPDQGNPSEYRKCTVIFEYIWAHWIIPEIECVSLYVQVYRFGHWNAYDVSIPSLFCWRFCIGDRSAEPVKAVSRPFTTRIYSLHQGILCSWNVSLSDMVSFFICIHSVLDTMNKIEKQFCNLEIFWCHCFE